MYRRGRPGRDRSRDPSRPFSQSRDRDRDYDNRYRREERHTNGHWEDLDRRGEERRRDERPPPTSLPLPQPTASPLPGHLPDFVRDPSKASNVRRDSRDGVRDPLPVDAARRHSGGSSSLSLRKEFSEPSPRERGMIGDPPPLQPPSRRHISNSSWPREDDRDRSDTTRSRKNSLERNPDHPRSPITESPRSFLPLASPTTSISAATPSNMAPAAPLLSTGVLTEKNSLSRLFQEASYAYIKYVDAQSNWKVADKERNDHSEHFNTFPVLKERYEGAARTAKKELQSATELLSKKSTALDQICSELIGERLSKRESESAIEFCDKIKKELGNSSSLTQFVRANAPAPPVQTPAPSRDEFLQLRDELREMKRKQQDEEKARQTFAKELQCYKNENSSRLQTQDAKLTGFQVVQSGLRADIERVKDENRKTADELKKIMSLLTATRVNVGKLEEVSNQKSDVVMTDSANESALNEVRKTLEELQKTVTTGQKRLLETNTKCRDIDATMIRVKNESETLQQKVSTLETAVTIRNKVGEAPPDGSSHRNCATKADIEQLVINIKNQDELLDTFRHGAEKDTSEILEEIQGLDLKVETRLQTTDQKVHDLNLKVETYNQSIGQMIRDLGQKTTSQITVLISEQEAVLSRNRTEIKEAGDSFGRQFSGLDAKLQGDMERLQHKVAFVENHLEGHLLAITHQEQRMNSFTTKDFYERVVANLIQINPLLFNYTNQLQLCNNEVKAIKETVRVLASQLEATRQRFSVITPSPRPLIHDGSSMDPPVNGTGRSDRSSEGPSPSLSAILKDLELHTDQIRKLDDRISSHIETYTAKMSDIKEWTVSCTQRLVENTASASHIMEEVGKLRAYLSAQGPESPHMATATSGVGRWRAVGGSPEMMQGLPDENGTGQ